MILVCFKNDNVAVIEARSAVVVIASNLIEINALATIIVVPPRAMSITNSRRPKMHLKLTTSSLKKMFPVNTLFIKK